MENVLGKNTICGSPPCTVGQDGDIVNRHVSAFDGLTGAHDSAGRPNSTPYVAHLGRQRLYVGGDFTKVNGENQPGFVIFPAGG